MERLIRLLAANRDIKIQERRDTGDEYSEDEIEKEQVQEKQEEEEKDRFPAAVCVRERSPFRSFNDEL